MCSSASSPTATLDASTLSYHEFLRNLTNAMSDLPRSQEDTGVNSATQKLPTISSPFPRQGRGLSTGGGVVVGLSEQLRQGVKAKWKAIYASLKTLDKANVGRVSAPHFRQLLEWYALAVADDEFLQLLRLFDHDDDGGVDYNKFMKACFT
jgi:Ca2+-binding EF-hand superfamily protein